jgi:hypothetical protein
MLGGRDFVVGIATSFGLGGLRFETEVQAAKDFLFSTHLQTGPGSTQPPVQLVPGVFAGVKAAGTST